MEIKPLEQFKPQPQYQQPEPEPSTVEVVIGNILKGVVCVFLICICFFIVVVVVSTLSGQDAVPFETYSQDFSISNPTMSQVVYTSNPLLSGIVVQKYNSSNSTWAGVPDSDWSYDSSWGSITINGSILAWDITQLRVSANTDYSESPHLSVFTALAVSLLVLAMGGIFGIIVWNKRKRQY